MNIISGDLIIPPTGRSALEERKAFIEDIDGVADPIARVARTFATLAVVIAEVVSLKANGVQRLTGEIGEINELMRTLNSKLKDLPNDDSPVRIVEGAKDAEAMKNYLVSLGFKKIGSTNGQAGTDFSYDPLPGGSYEIVMTKKQITTMSNNLQLMVDDKSALSSQLSTEMQSSATRMNAAVDATSAAIKSTAAQVKEIAHGFKGG